MIPSRRTLPVLIVFLLQFSSVSAQLAAGRGERSLNTEEKDPGTERVGTAADPIPWAAHMHRDPDRQGLPYILEVVSLGNGVTAAEPRLVEATYTTLSTQELAALPGLGQPGAEVALEVALGITRKVTEANVTIRPYRRNDRTGAIERLVSYRLEFSVQRGGGGARANSYPDHSKLRSGDWFRFTVERDGVHRLDHAFLRQLGVDTDGLSSASINIYGNHEGQLPYTNTPFRPTDLLLNRIEVVDGGDGSFDAGDYILFHATGPIRWERAARGFRYVPNVYTTTASYFIGIGTDPPARIGDIASVTDAATHTVTAFNDRQVNDRDQVSVLKSGRVQFAEVYDNVTTYNYSFQFPNLRAADPVALRMGLFARTINHQTSNFQVQAAGQSAQFPIPGVDGHYEHAYGTWQQATMSVNHSATVLPITVTFNKHDPLTSIGHMDFLEVNARRELRMSGDQMLFRDTVSVGAGRISEFILDQATGVHRVWDVTDPTQVGNVLLAQSGVQRTFRLPTEELRTFIAFRNTGYLSPTAVGRVPNQDLHATALPTDLVIICPDVFRSEAMRLAERRVSEGLTVAVVSPQQVYNEFSSGQRDATAIKRFMKMLYDRAGTDAALMPRYLLLFGDGTYNNLIPEGTAQNWIPTYQSWDSWTPSGSYTSDDYYALLDDTEGEQPGDRVDIGVGRFPVSDLAQARSVVNKVLNYDRLSMLSDGTINCATGSEGGASDWRNWLLLVSDDQDGNGAGIEPYHTTNSETLSVLVNNLKPQLNQAKVYMDAYTQYSTPGGQRYPDGAQALRERVQKGALLVNYVGHGGEVGWGHERFLDVNTILGWSNADRLPLFMTATCEFSRWDDPARTSAGEHVLLNPNGGGVGLMTTTRIAYSSTNQSINLAFYNEVFGTTDEQGRPKRIGDVYRRVKRTGESVSYRSFALLADPTLQLALPRQEVFITAITDTLGVPVDTLKALSVVRISGHVGSIAGPDPSFNGSAIPLVFDKLANLHTLANDPPSNPQPFTLWKNILYRGKATVQNGVFNFLFLVPKDINYAVGPGRLSVYAESGTSNAAGYTHNVLVGGSNPTALNDTEGPRIELYMNDERFVNGGITNTTPLVWAKLFDDSGINTTGNSIGHDLVAIIDANTPNAIVLNDLYEADQDSYKSGQVRYRLAALTEGAHTITVKAWDGVNNSSEKTVDLVVASDEELALERVLNYPNPFTTRTEFYFEHNRPCETLECQVQVFTVAGRLVKTISRRLTCDGFRSEPLVWDGLDDHGDRLARGVYVYRLSITAPDGAKADKLEKLVILR